MDTNKRKELLKEISQLPQADHIYIEDAEKWVDRVSFSDPDRIKWHIKRSGGIGGSEIATLVSWQYDNINSRENVHRLAKKKLFLLTPDRANDDTSRGIYLENHIQSVYENKLDKLGFIWTRRDDIKKQIDGNAHPKYPWLRANVDAVYQINNQIVITDFKAPSENSLENYRKQENYDEYAYQLNHYALVAEGLGIKIDRLELAFYDYRRVASIGTENIHIPISLEMKNEIIESSTIFWKEYILNGKIPDDTRKNVVTIEDLPDDVLKLSQEALMLKIISDNTEKRYKEIQSLISNWINDNGGLQDNILALGSFNTNEAGYLEFKSKEVMNIPECLQRLKDLGMVQEDIEKLRSPDKFDVKKLGPIMPDVHSMLQLIIDKTNNKEDLDTSILKSIQKLIKKTDIKEQGDYDENLIIDALVKLGEMDYHKNSQISSSITRKKNEGLDDLKFFIGTSCNKFVDTLVSCKKEEYDLNTKNNM